jgi:hypothetical protein
MSSRVVTRVSQSPRPTVTFGAADGGWFGPAPTTLAAVQAPAPIRDLKAALATGRVIGVAQGNAGEAPPPDSLLGLSSSAPGEAEQQSTQVMACRRRRI